MYSKEGRSWNCQAWSWAGLACYKTSKTRGCGGPRTHSWKKTFILERETKHRLRCVWTHCVAVLRFYYAYKGQRRNVVRWASLDSFVFQSHLQSLVHVNISTDPRSYLLTSGCELVYFGLRAFIMFIVTLLLMRMCSAMMIIIAWIGYSYYRIYCFKIINCVNS